MKPITETDIDYICELNAPCFQMLSAEEKGVVKSSRTQVQFRRGDNLTKQGAFASYMLFVVKGLAVQYVEGDNGKSFNIRIVKQGEFLGLSSVFSTNTFGFSSVALIDCHVFLVEKDAIAKIIQQNGTFGLGLIRRYSEQNENCFDLLRTTMYKQMNGRMAESLLYIDSFKKEYPNIFQLLLRKDLADFAGISTESAVKLLKSFQKDGLVELDDKDVQILDHKGLQEISKRG